MVGQSEPDCHSEEESLPSSFREAMFVLRHVHAGAAKRDPFHAQAEPLLSAVLSGQLDRSPGAHYPMPWQPRNLIQNPHHLPRRPRPSSSSGHRAIS